MAEKQPTPDYWGGTPKNRAEIRPTSSAERRRRKIPGGCCKREIRNWTKTAAPAVARAAWFFLVRFEFRCAARGRTQTKRKNPALSRGPHSRGGPALSHEAERKRRRKLVQVVLFTLPGRVFSPENKGGAALFVVTIITFS